MRFGSTALLFVLVACSKPESAAPPVASTSTVTPSAAVIGKAEVGKPAPDFALSDLDGKEVKLSSFKGKVVVLEWFNPGCPFVQRSHSVGSLVDTAKRHMKDGVTWLAINSGAAGKQGAAADANAEAVKKWAIPNPVLRDEAGTVGKA